MFNKKVVMIVLLFTILMNNIVQAAEPLANHESPSMGSIESGVGVIRGWACEANEIYAVIDDDLIIDIAYGTSRGDTQAVCGDSNNGYGATFNWNLLSSGEHRIRTYLDGVIISDIRFQVTAITNGFLRDLQRETSLNDFPNIGDQLNLSWSQAHQNFVISDFYDNDQSSSPFSEIRLLVDVAQLTGQAEYALSSTTGNNLTLEVAGLTILAVFVDGNPLSYHVENGNLQLTLPTIRQQLVIKYQFFPAAPFQGLFRSGDATYTWPYYCENLFPCLSEPELAVRYQLQLTGIAADETAIYPPQVIDKAPAYQLAWATGDYSYLQLGITDAGTRVGVWTLPNHRTLAEIGTEKLPMMFDWLEKQLGPYRFGNDVASVDVDWPNSSGGMEHHPYWHIETSLLNDPETHIHEAAHGWFGNGIRLACWEDFVLSEGVVSYLAAVAIGVAYGSAEEDLIWQDYDRRLQAAMERNNHIAWPESCGVVDVLDLFTDIPYMKGAFFFRDVEHIIGRDDLLAALSVFYHQYSGKAATFDQLLDSLYEQTQFDPHPLANAWLRSLTLP